MITFESGVTIKLLLMILMTYRLASLVAYDEGPFGLMESIRLGVGAYDYGPNGLATTILGRGIACPHCVGFWIALILSALFFGIFTWNLPIYWIAAAGGQSFLHSLITKGNG